MKNPIHQQLYEISNWLITCANQINVVLQEEGFLTTPQRGVTTRGTRRYVRGTRGPKLTKFGRKTQAAAA